MVPILVISDVTAILMGQHDTALDQRMRIPGVSRTPDPDRFQIGYAGSIPVARSVEVPGQAVVTPTASPSNALSG